MNSDRASTITIDGSRGEGGGQVLRTALALSLVTGRPFRIEKIRAGRNKPGLLRQHLTAVRAAADVGSAEVTGDELGGHALGFVPHGIRAGEYRFAVGTAGSSLLVLQTILPALWSASGPSTIVLEGGTHNPFAPPFEFLDRAFLPIVRRMGPTVEMRLERRGFYPAGGGKVVVRVDPAAPLQPIEIVGRGEIRSTRARAVVSAVPRHVAQRELDLLERELGWDRSDLSIEHDSSSPGPGNVLVAEIEAEGITELFVGFGEKGVPAEKVAESLVSEIRAWLTSGAPVGPHLADQLMIPFALAGAGEFATMELSGHSRTNLDVIRLFLDLPIDVSASGGLTRVRFGKASDR